MKLGFTVVALVAGTTMAIAQDGQLIPYDDPQAVSAGEPIYVEMCASCHGADLEGEPDWRTPHPDGMAKAPPHDETGHTWHHPDIQLALLTKFGVSEMEGNGYESNMPGFGDVLSDSEILAVLAYIKSTWPDEVIARHNEINAANAQ